VTDCYNKKTNMFLSSKILYIQESDQNRIESSVKQGKVNIAVNCFGLRYKIKQKKFAISDKCVCVGGGASVIV